jgi:hypothetical protein
LKSKPARIHTLSIGRIRRLLPMVVCIVLLDPSKLYAQYNSLGDVQISSYGTERMRITTPGWVGIGTTAPKGALDIFLTGTASALIVPRDTTANRPATGFQVDGMIRYNTTTNKFEAYENGAWTNMIDGVGQWTTSGSDIYYNSGNVGIGTTSPTWLLDLNGNSALNTAGAYPGISMTNSNPTAGDGTTTYNRANVVVSSGNGAVKGSLFSVNETAGTYAGGGVFLRTTTNSPLAFMTNTIERMRIDSSGNVGIGTTNPAAKLEITASSPVSASAAGQLIVSGAETTGAADTGASLTLSGHDGTQGRTWSTIQGLKENATPGDYSGYLRFTTRPNGTIGQERMRITSAGNVGIGTTSPNASLQVNGTITGKAAVSNTTGPVNFGTGNIQYTTNDCAAYALYNLKDGGSYTFVVKGTNSATCSFTAYSDGGTTPLTVHLPPGHDATVSSSHTMYNFVVVGSDVYVAWIPNY